MPRSRTPVTQVQAAPHRNQNRARGRSSGITVFLVPPSSFPSNWPFTKLKKYRCPIHRIPAKTCIHRNKASNAAEISPILRLLQIDEVLVFASDWKIYCKAIRWACQEISPGADPFCRSCLRGCMRRVRQCPYPYGSRPPGRLPRKTRRRHTRPDRCRTLWAFSRCSDPGAL